MAGICRSRTDRPTARPTYSNANEPIYAELQAAGIRAKIDVMKNLDSETTLSELKEIVRCFVDERNWNQFHSPKNLSMALAVEAAELMEHFQWITIDESRAVESQPEKLQDIADEVADVLCYVLALANVLEIDLSDSLQKKMAKNIAKYPVQDFRGRFQKESVG